MSEPTTTTALGSSGFVRGLRRVQTVLRLSVYGLCNIVAVVSVFSAIKDNDPRALLLLAVCALGSFLMWPLDESP